ncbi:hypothetical protein A9R05_27750 [Burkholderia sp. KK1]|nr:hypothetical protein A9R05_27750 [Burkholderia sp. KK1]
MVGRALSQSEHFIRAEADLDKCESIIAYARKVGTPLDDADIEVVRNSRRALDQGQWNGDIARVFYSAMSRLDSAVHYPSLSIVRDIDGCRDMISYGAQTGKVMDERDIEAFSKARAAQQSFAWSVETESGFYAAMSRIAHAVTPVGAETVGGEAREGARRSIRVYTRSAIALTVVVAVLLCLLFISNQISSDIRTLVSSNDAAALTLHNQLQAYAVEIDKAANDKGNAAALALRNSQSTLQLKKGLQNFTANNLKLFADVSRISGLTSSLGLGAVRNPYKLPCGGTSSSRLNPDGGAVENDWRCNPDEARSVLELSLSPLAKPRADAGDAHPPTDQDAIEQGFQKIGVYQDVRAMALYANDTIRSFDAVIGFLLPVLCAWLGACAAILRQISSESAASIYHPEYSKVANRAHVTTAIIVGISTGIFNALIEGGKIVPPLAVAFVAGYASDTFFNFIDRLMNAEFRIRDAASAREEDGIRTLIEKLTLHGEPGQRPVKIPLPPNPEND